MRRPSNLLANQPAALTPSQPSEPEAPKNYVELYGLAKPPFGNAGEMAYILFNSHRRAFELVVSHLENGRGAILLAGEEGAGKTEMLRATAEVAANAGVHVERLFRPASGRLSSEAVRRALTGGNAPSDRRLAIVIDDADLLPTDCVNDLREAMVPKQGSNSAPALVLGASSHAAQTQLDQLLPHVQNTLRVVPLNPVEVREYVERSLWLAGGTTRRLMDADALKLVIAQAGGMPGMVNRIMEAVLTAGFARGDAMITGKTVAAATGPVVSRRPRAFAPRDLRSLLSRDGPSDGLAQPPSLPAFVGDLRPRQALPSPDAAPAAEPPAPPAPPARAEPMARAQEAPSPGNVAKPPPRESSSANQTRIVRPNSGNTTVVRPPAGRQAREDEATRTQISNETIRGPELSGSRMSVREGFGKAADRPAGSGGRTAPVTTTVVQRPTRDAPPPRPGAPGLSARKPGSDPVPPAAASVPGGPRLGRLMQFVSIAIFVAGIAVFSYRALVTEETPPANRPVPTAAPNTVAAAPPPQAPQPAPAPTTSLPPDVMDALLKRGAQSLSLGDVAAARLFYQRAAEAGNGTAAMALGRTYDPNYTVRGSTPDPARAAEWYRKAIAAGEPTAPGLLQKLNGS